MMTIELAMMRSQFYYDKIKTPSASKPKKSVRPPWLEKHKIRLFMLVMGTHETEHGLA